MTSNLREHMRFHANFHQPDAVHARGNAVLHTVLASPGKDGQVQYDLHEGIATSNISLIGDDRFGGALSFDAADDSSFLFYPAIPNVAYSDDGFDGSASFWLRTNPAAIGGVFADPLQIGDTDATNSSLWVDFAREPAPTRFRLGIFGDPEEWDSTNERGKGPDFFRRLVATGISGFSDDRWVHVVMTWASINGADAGSGHLYLDGEHVGESGPVSERFSWQLDQATIRLGLGPFVGAIADLAIFDRALTLAEVQRIHSLPNGIAGLD